MGLDLKRRSRNRFEKRDEDRRMQEITKKKCRGKNEGSETPFKEQAGWETHRNNGFKGHQTLGELREKAFDNCSQEETPYQR